MINFTDLSEFFLNLMNATKESGFQTLLLKKHYQKQNEEYPREWMENGIIGAKF